MTRVASVALLMGLAACGEAETGNLLTSPGPDGGAQVDLSTRPDLGIDADMGTMPDLGTPDVGLLIEPGDPCGMLLEPGPCQAAIRRYSFDPDRGRCVEVTWGGCGDNANNYQSMTRCALDCEPGTSACGGFAGRTCDRGQFCDWTPSSCGAADEQGVCRPRPTGCFALVDPVCGCNGETYRNACEAHAVGVDVAAEGPCRRAPTCNDRDPAFRLVSALRDFGRCAGECTFFLRVLPSNAPVEPRCDVVELVVRSIERGPPERVNAGVLTPEGHQAIRDAVRNTAGASIDRVYGCPGCTDLPAAELTFVRNGVGGSSRYEPQRVPEILRPIDAVAAELLEGLNNCRSGRYVQVSRGCVPPPGR